MVDAVLPDLFHKKMDVIFCGTRPGTRSAKEKAYYAHPGNKFWPILFEMGLLPKLFKPSGFNLVHKYGIGLTDLGKDSHGPDKGWKPTSHDVDRLRKHIQKWQPRVLAFTSKTSAQYFYGRKVELGPQPEAIGKTVIYVLPSTSGLAQSRWDKTYWLELGRYLKSR